MAGILLLMVSKYFILSVLAVFASAGYLILTPLENRDDSCSPNFGIVQLKEHLITSKGIDLVLKSNSNLDIFNMDFQVSGLIDGKPVSFSPITIDTELMHGEQDVFSLVHDPLPHGDFDFDIVLNYSYNRNPDQLDHFFSKTHCSGRL